MGTAILEYLSHHAKGERSSQQAAQAPGSLAQQMVIVVRRWLPTVPIKIIGDGAYSVIELGLMCVKWQASLIAPLRLDARLFAPPPQPEPHQMGRPRVVGKRLPNLSTVLNNPKTEWETHTIHTKRVMRIWGSKPSGTGPT